VIIFSRRCAIAIFRPGKAPVDADAEACSPYAAGKREEGNAARAEKRLARRRLGVGVGL